MPEAVHFQGIINFLNRSRLHVALSTDPYISLVYIQQFWDTVHQDIDVEPHVLRATVNNTEIVISEETIRAALDLGGNVEDPISYPNTLIMGCFQRMGYRGRQNDTQARKGGLVGEWRYFVHVIIQCISPRKAGTDGLKLALQTAMVALTLNKRFNFPLYFYREMVMQINPAEGQGFLMYPRFIQMILNHLIPDLPHHAIRLTLTPMSKRIFTDCTKVKLQNAALIPVNTPLFGHLINPDYVAPPNDNCSSSSDTISSDDDSTDSDESRDFSPARRPRRKSVRDPPSGSVLGKRSLVDESSNTDSDFNPDPTRPKLMSASTAAAKSSQGVEDANFVASLIITPPRSKDPSPVHTPVPPPSDSDRITFLESQVLSLQTQVNSLVSIDSQRQLVIQTQAQQIADMQALVSKLVQRLDAQGELRIPDTCHTESIQRRDDEDNDPAGNIEGDRQYTDANPISRVQGESTSQSLEGNKDKDTSGTNDEEILLLEFFQDSEEEEAEKIECLDDIDDLFNDMDEDMSDTKIEEGEIVEIEIEKDKNIVTYEDCDGLKVPYNFIQEDVVPEFSYDGITDSMDSIEDVTLPDDTAESKMDNDDENLQFNKSVETETTHTESPKINEEPVMYRDTGMTREQWREVPRIKFFNTLPRCEINGLASKPLINRSKNGLADVIANLIKKEGSSGKYERLKPQKGKRVKNTDPKTGKVTWRYKYRPVRDIHKIPLKNIPHKFLGNMKWWYVDVNTGEARVEDIDNKVIVCFYDAMNLINFSKKDQWTLRKNEIMYTDEWREQGLQYKRVLEICRRYGVHAGSRLPDNWKSSR
ncbi:hypothetical protein L1987_18718 [Smallanthus sonchifolius]|uniref:Uncharacterized protein n=1 Tax=Smallanthus sonchifolius TaxID=185202 RepID=A0ACB9J332_9ASTR|nr:hypothetical protein L1987_18718 [Smallanthus sonchifolius]